MIVVKRRLLFWLVKAYIKKWGRMIILGFFLGLVAFFLILIGMRYIVPKIILGNREVIGVVGSYTVDTLPEQMLREISHGLTMVNDKGQVKPDLALSWSIDDKQKTYTFQLRQDKLWNDGTRFTSADIQTSFSDVTVQKPDQYTIVYQLKDVYAPFLVTVARPVFKKEFVGIGDYGVKNVKLNGNFVQSIILYAIKNSSIIKTYRFYPTQDALKLAFALGEITEASGLQDLSFQDTSFKTFPNVSLHQKTDYTQLVTLFYNTQDSALSDKRLRDALAYSLPNIFPQGEKAHSPFSPQSWAYQADLLHVQDIDHAKLLLEAAGFTTKDKLPHLTITTLSKYKKIAQSIEFVWKKIGIDAKIQVVDTIPSSFQIYLGDIHIPKDPDQYTLWHSYQQNNITNYKSLRIDKLLEDGRKTIDQEKRIKIYTDFQKYLMDDQPASFLYYPYVYTIVRK